MSSSDSTTTNTTTAEAGTNKAQGDFYRELDQVMQIVHESESFADAMPIVQERLLQILDAERMTVYQKGRNDREIVSKFKTGLDVTEIRVPLNASSIAGYVALSQRAVLISDVARPGALEKIHPKLKFNQSFDKQSGFKTESVIAIPIKHQSVLLGVLQLLNHRGGGSFTKEDFYKAEVIAKHLAQKFRYDLKATKGPYDYLIQKELVTREKLEEFRQRAQSERISINDVLVQARDPRAELGASLEAYYQVPYLGFSPGIAIPKDLLSGINPNYIKQQTWVPVSYTDEEVVILIDDPSNASLIMEIQRLIPAKQYVFKVGLIDEIRRFLGVTGGIDSKINKTDLLDKLQKEDDEKRGELQALEDSNIVVGENEATVIQLVNHIIVEAFENRASDIHIEPAKGKNPSIVRIRVDGVCRVLISVPPTHKEAVISRIKIMSKLDISERRKPQDGKAATKIQGRGVELRVATLPTVNGEAVVMRILASGEPVPFNKLNLSERNFKILDQITDSPHGIALVVGPTGSGKTTSLHAVLGKLNTPARKIWTAEDPVEITQNGLQQVQMQPKIGLTFAAALRSFLRADPDVIMIGEMRDYETAHSAIEASLTGHLVLSTLHTNSAPETVTRLLDLGLDPASFSDALLGVLAQRLVRTLCPKCKKPEVLSLEQFRILQRYYGEEHFEELGLVPGQSILYQAVGCSECGNSGYRGRMGIHELLHVTPEMRSLIYRKASATEIKQLAVSQGMRTLMQDGIAKMVKGMTDLEQVRKIASA